MILNRETISVCAHLRDAYSDVFGADSDSEKLPHHRDNAEGHVAQLHLCSNNLPEILLLIMFLQKAMRHCCQILLYVYLWTG
jgi:hypothetical protein